MTITTSAEDHQPSEDMMTTGERSALLSWRYIHIANRLDAIAAPLTFTICNLYVLALTFDWL